MISQRLPSYRHRPSDEDVFTSLIDMAMTQLRPPAMPFEKYERMNQVHEEREKYAKAYGSKPLIQLFATCPWCLGRCFMENPEQEYDYDNDTGDYIPRLPEEVPCDTCAGTGWVEIEPEPEPAPEPEIVF